MTKQKDNNNSDAKFIPSINEEKASDINFLENTFFVLRARKKIVCLFTGMFFLGSLFFSLYQRKFNPKFEGSFVFLITDPFREKKQSRFSEQGGAVLDELARNTTENDIPTLIEYLKSPLLLEPLAQKYDKDLNELINNIAIFTIGTRRQEAKGILNVFLYTKNYKKDEALLNDLSDLYLNAALQQKQRKLTDGLAFLNRQAPQLEEKRASLHGELSAFREKNNLLEPSAEGVTLKRGQATISTTILKLQSQKNRLIKIKEEIKKGRLSARGFQSAVGDILLDGNQVQGGLSISDSNQSILKEQINLEERLAASKGIYTPDSKIIKGLETRLRVIEPITRQYQLDAVDSAIDLNNSRTKDAREQKAVLSEEFNKKPALIEKYETLQQRLLIAQDNLSALVKTRERFQLEMAQNAIPWTLISAPRMNPYPIKPSIPKNLFASLLFGFFVGAIAALLRDKFDYVYKSSEEVKNSLRLPILGVIPYVKLFEGLRQEKKSILESLDTKIDKKDPNLKEERYQRFFYQEAFRNLITSIKFLSTDEKIKTLVMTSSIASEGKSLLNIILSKTFADSGQRVLLIDSDLRKPQLHTRLGMNNLRGLSNLLTDKNLIWEDLVLKLPNNKNLDLIPAGIKPPDPTKILNSKRMEEIVNSIKSSKNYDIIIFDTPPILGLADSALISNYVDGVILIITLNTVNKKLPKEAVSRIYESNAQLLGCLVNTNREVKSFKSIGGYGYGNYGYGNYGYGGYGYGNYGYGGYYSESVYANYASYVEENNQDLIDLKNDEKDNLQSNNEESYKSKVFSINSKLVQTINEKLNKFLSWLDS